MVSKHPLDVAWIDGAAAAAQRGEAQRAAGRLGDYRLLLLLLLGRSSFLLLLRSLLHGDCLPLVLQLSSSGLRGWLVVVIVATADERKCRRANAGGRIDAQERMPRDAEVRRRGLGGGPIRKLVKLARGFLQHVEVSRVTETAATSDDHDLVPQEQG